MSWQRQIQVLLVAACAGLSACQHIPEVPGLALIGGATSALTEDELRAGLRQYAMTFGSIVSATTQEISSRTRDRTIRLRALRWKVELIPLVKSASHAPDPKHAYVGILALAVGLREYLEEGTGAALFAEHQPIAVKAAHELEHVAWSLGSRFLAPAEQERLKRDVEVLVHQHPIRGEFAAGGLIEGVLSVKTRRSFAWVVDLPMTPFRALAGVNEGAQGIREFNQTAIQLADLFADLPRLLRWQLELLLYDVEDRDTMTEGLAAFEVLAESSRRLSQAAESLPESLAEDAAATLESARETVAQAEAALGQVQGMIGPLGGFAEQVQAAGDAWAAALREVRGDGEPDPDARPFDIREVERAAQEIRLAGAGLQELVIELRALVAAPELPQVAAGLEGSGHSLIDAAAWRILQLILVSFVLLVVYRAVSSRIGRRSNG